MALHPLKAYAENCISLLLFGLTQVMNSGVRASCSNNKESDNEIWNLADEIYFITKYIRFLHGIEEPSTFALFLMCSFVVQLVLAPNSIWGVQV